MSLQVFIDWLVVALRWIHIVAILGWVGTSLYFMWLDSKLRAANPPDDRVLGEAWMGHGGGFYIVQKRLITAGQVPAPVWWFRNEAAVTWITGFLLLVFLYYWTGGADLVDPETSALPPQWAVAFAVALLAVAWIVYDCLWASPFGDKRIVLANLISLALLFGVVVLLCKLFTGRAAVIHIGAVMGTNMVANVWTRIIPAQEEAVAATKEGRERNMTLATRARRRAIHNTYLTLPVIFTMIATHAPGTYSHPLNWLVLSLLIVAGIAARHLMILYDRREPSRRAWLSTAAPLVASVAALGLLSAPRGVPVPEGAPVPFTVVRGIVELRCASCHSRNPTDPALPAAPNAVRFDTAEEIALRAPAIKASVLARTMPPGNGTGMTNEERALLGRWVDQGARVENVARQ